MLIKLLGCGFPASSTAGLWPALMPPGGGPAILPEPVPTKPRQREPRDQGERACLAPSRERAAPSGQLPTPRDSQPRDRSSCSPFPCKSSWRLSGASRVATTGRRSWQSEVGKRRASPMVATPTPTPSATGDRAAPMVSSPNLSVGASVAGQGYAAWFDLVPSSVSSRSESR